MNKSKPFLLLLLFALGSLLILLMPSARAWQTSISDCQGCGSRSQAVVVDAAGNLIAIGDFFDGSDVVKLSKETGNAIWRSEVMGHESRNHAQAIAIDSQGNVFVVFSYTRVVVKVSGASGTEIWRKPIGGTLNALLPVINAVAIDRDDNVVTAGTMGGNFNVCKLDGRTGDEKWHNDVRGGIAKAVAVDPFGNIAAAGIMNANFAVMKLQGENGAELWQSEISGAGNFSNDFEEANAVAMDKDGSVAVAGVTSNEVANFRDFTVAKYRPDGTRQWTEIVDGRYISQNDRGEQFNQSNDIAYAVTIDKAGNVIAAGSIQEDDYVPRFRNEPEHFEVVKIGRDGGVQWSAPAEDHTIGEEYISGHAFAVSVDDAGDVAAAGVHDGRFTVVKFCGETGVCGTKGKKPWPPYQVNSAGLGNGNNGLSVVVDSARNIVAAGETLGSDGWPKFTVVKARGIDGTDYFAAPSPTPTPDFQGALLRYKPILKFNSDENYFPISVESITDNSGNKLQRRVIANSFAVLAKSPPAGKWPVLNIDFLGQRYHSIGIDASDQDFIDAQNDHEHDAFLLQLNPKYSDRIYGRISYGLNAQGEKVAWLQYWFFYYYNDYRSSNAGGITFDQHEGDWEMVRVALDANAYPLSALYAQHDYASQCVWNGIEKSGPSNERPVVYVGRGSHASYFHAGSYRIYHYVLSQRLPLPAFDTANGLLSKPDQELRIIVDASPNEPDQNKKLFSPNWVNWRGHWGGTTKPTGVRPPLPFDSDSPQGPRFQGDKWTSLPAFSSKWPFDCR